MPCSTPRPPHAAGAPPRHSAPRLPRLPSPADSNNLAGSAARRHSGHLLAPRTDATPRGATRRPCSPHASKLLRYEDYHRRHPRDPGSKPG